MTRRWSELRLAVMFLTRLPVGQVREPVPSLSDAAWAFPFAGAIVGSVGAALWVFLASLGITPLLAAVVVLTVQAGITGALHFDGLADFADGIGGGRDRAHCLEIMRDSRIGSYGVVALVLVALAWVSALSDMTPWMGAGAVLAMAVASRLAMLVLLVEMPSARDSGLGQSAGHSARRVYVSGALLALLLCAPLGIWGLLGAMGAAAGAAWVAWRAHRRIGGQTGDVLGAAQKLGETCGLVVLSLA